MQNLLKHKESFVQTRQWNGHIHLWPHPCFEVEAVNVTCPGFLHCGGGINYDFVLLSPGFISYTNIMTNHEELSPWLDLHKHILCVQVWRRHGQPWGQERDPKNKTRHREILTGFGKLIPKMKFDPESLFPLTHIGLWFIPTGLTWVKYMNFIVPSPEDIFHLKTEEKKMMKPFSNIESSSFTLRHLRVPVQNQWFNNFVSKMQKFSWQIIQKYSKNNPNCRYRGPWCYSQW